MRAGAALSGELLRLDLHPADFDHPRHVLARRARAAARARPHPGHVRRPLLNAPRGGPARELARGHPPRRHAVRLHLPVAAALQAPVVLGLVLPRDRLDAHRPRAARRRSCGRCCAPGGPTASSRTPRSGGARRAGGARRCTRPSTSAATPGRRRSRRRCSRVAWERVADGDDAFRRGARAARRARALADPRARPRRRRPDHDPAARRVRPRRLAQVRRASTARSRTDKPGYARLVQRCRRARLERARRSRARPTSTSRTCWSTSRTRSRCARCAAMSGEPEWAEHADAHRGGADGALLGCAARPVLRPRRARRAPRRGLDLVVAGAARARAASRARSASASPSEHLLNPRRYGARFGVPSVSMEEPSFRPGFNAYRTWRGAAWVNTAWLMVGGLRALGADDEADRLARASPTRPSAAASASTTTRARAPATASTASAGRRCCSTSPPGFPSPRRG